MIWLLAALSCAVGIVVWVMVAWAVMIKDLEELYFGR